MGRRGVRLGGRFWKMRLRRRGQRRLRLLPLPLRWEQPCSLLCLDDALYQPMKAVLGRVGRAVRTCVHVHHEHLRSRPFRPFSTAMPLT